MHSRCLNCKNWQGTRHSTLGDCHYIVGDLLPLLFDYRSLFGWKFKLPFDPHDVKYFPDIQNHLLKCGEYGLPEGVRKGTRREQDVKFIQGPDGSVIGERTGSRTIVCPTLLSS